MGITPYVSNNFIKFNQLHTVMTTNNIKPFYMAIMLVFSSNKYNVLAFVKSSSYFSLSDAASMHFFKYINKNIFYKNVEGEINQNIKNALRTFLKLRVN